MEWYDVRPGRVGRPERCVLTGTGVHTNFRSVPAPFVAFPPVAAGAVSP